jgi:hypothetical protein
MIKLDRLPEVAGETLSGLNAGPALLYRSRERTAGSKAGLPRPKMSRGFAFALSLALVIGLSALVLPRLRQPEVPSLTTLAAGQAPDHNIKTSARDLPRGSLVLSKAPQPAYQGVWASGSGANFPLIRVDGRFYRLLTHPQDVSALLGKELGQVEVFTPEPALDAGGAILSNTAAMEAPVYTVTGMGKGAALAAMVNGSPRLFQRVSFSGNALIGNEDLSDTLPGNPRTMQLSDVGTVSDVKTIARLMDLLLSSSYEGSQNQSSGQALLLQYENGAVFQLAVSGDTFSACGTWANTDFFLAFRAAVE